MGSQCISSGCVVPLRSRGRGEDDVIRIPDSLCFDSLRPCCFLLEPHIPNNAPLEILPEYGDTLLDQRLFFLFYAHFQGAEQVITQFPPPGKISLCDAAALVSKWPWRKSETDRPFQVESICQVIL